MKSNSNSSTEIEEENLDEEKPLDTQKKVELETYTSTTIKPSGLTFEDLTNKHLQSEIKSPKPFEIALYNANIPLIELISSENFKLLSKIEDLTDFINKKNKIIIYMDENQGQRNFFIYGEKSTNFKSLDKPPFGYDPRLFCVSDFQSKEPIPMSRDYISQDDINFLISIKNKCDVDYSIEGLKRFNKVMKLNQFSNNFEHYYELFRENLELNVPMDQENESLIDTENGGEIMNGADKICFGNI